MNTTISNNKRLACILLAVAVLLSIPFIAMQFTSSVRWTGFDFAVAAGLLLGTGLLCEWVLRKVHTRNARIALCLVLLVCLLLAWAELAVGLFGTPFAGS